MIKILYTSSDKTVGLVIFTGLTFRQTLLLAPTVTFDQKYFCYFGLFFVLLNYLSYILFKKYRHFCPTVILPLISSNNMVLVSLLIDEKIL